MSDNDRADRLRFVFLCIVMVIVATALLVGACVPAYTEDFVDRGDGLSTFSPRPGIECIYRSGGNSMAIGCYNIPEECGNEG